MGLRSQVDGGLINLLTLTLKSYVVPETEPSPICTELELIVQELIEKEVLAA